MASQLRNTQYDIRNTQNAVRGTLHAVRYKLCLGCIYRLELSMMSLEIPRLRMEINCDNKKFLLTPDRICAIIKWFCNGGIPVSVPIGMGIFVHLVPRRVLRPIRVRSRRVESRVLFSADLWPIRGGVPRIPMRVL
jgi:hypothetical protein